MKRHTLHRIHHQLAGSQESEDVDDEHSFAMVDAGRVADEDHTGADEVTVAAGTVADEDHTGADRLFVFCVRSLISEVYYNIT